MHFWCLNVYVAACVWAWPNCSAEGSGFGRAGNFLEQFCDSATWLL